MRDLTLRSLPERIDRMVPSSLIPANADPVTLIHSIRGMAREAAELLTDTMSVTTGAPNGCLVTGRFCT